jgi:hypothetical protein
MLAPAVDEGRPPPAQHTQVADERLEPAAVAGRRDHDARLGARAIGEQHVGALESLECRDDLDAPGLDRGELRWEWSRLTIVLRMDAELPELPAALRSTSTSPFVGRAAELEKLRTLMPRVEGEGRRVALLAGEAGAGKSRLVSEFAGRAAIEGPNRLAAPCFPRLAPYGLKIIRARIATIKAAAA